MLNISPEWYVPPHGVWGCTYGVVEQSFEDLQAFAAALRRVADSHGLAVSLSEDESYLCLVRARP